MFGKDKLKILLAIDFSLGSKNALKTLKLIQNEYKTDTALIHVVASFWQDWMSSGLHQKEAEQRLRSWQKEFAGSSNINKLYIKVGNPAENILEVSSKGKVNLILLGGKVAEEFSRYKTSTATESVVRSASKPVWICQSNKISKILCGIDGSSSSKKALQFAIDISRRYSAQLCIMYAVPSYLPAFGMSEKTIQVEEKKFMTQHTNNIMKFIKSFDLKKIKHKIKITWGVPANVLLNTAEDHGYNLIVIGAKGHSILHHVLLGSTAEKILRYAPCSLLIVR